MGQVFENANLVIAAAGVKDPSGSLFDMPGYPHLTVSIRVPPHHREFSVTCRSHHGGSPMAGWLGTRTWAFQEWRLARCILFFMPRGMSWHCRTDTLDECGPVRDLGTRGWLDRVDYTSLYSWQRNLHEYKTTELTFISDRLPAIQGLANNFKRALGENYRLGNFSKDLAKQLIWIHSRTQLYSVLAAQICPHGAGLPSKVKSSF